MTHFDGPPMDSKDHLARLQELGTRRREKVDEALAGVPPPSGHWITAVSPDGNLFTFDSRRVVCWEIDNSWVNLIIEKLEPITLIRTPELVKALREAP